MHIYVSGKWNVRSQSIGRREEAYDYLMRYACFAVMDDSNKDVATGVNRDVDAVATKFSTTGSCRSCPESSARTRCNQGQQAIGSREPKATGGNATVCNCGELFGSKPEVEVQAIEIALKYAYTHKSDVVIHTDFPNVQKRINGRIKATSQSTKSFAAFAKIARETIDIEVVEELPSGEREILDYILDNFSLEEHKGWQYCEVVVERPTFRVVVRDRNGNVICDANERFFGGVLADATQFANWFERESKDKESRYYGVTVERYNC